MTTYASSTTTKPYHLGGFFWCWCMAPCPAPICQPAQQYASPIPLHHDPSRFLLLPPAHPDAIMRTSQLATVLYAPTYAESLTPWQPPVAATTAPTFVTPRRRATLSTSPLRGFSTPPPPRRRYKARAPPPVAKRQPDARFLLLRLPPLSTTARWLLRSQSQSQFLPLFLSPGGGMAGRSSSMSMVASHRLFAPVHGVGGGGDHGGVELDEADVIWGGGGPAVSSSPSSASPFLSPAAAADPCARSPPVAAPSKAKPRGGGGPASVPVNIPDWSKILGAEYAGSCAAARGWAAHDDRADAFADDVVGSGGRRWVPPHEMLQCRERAAASFSMREGAGRTFKGRDLRRWELRGAVTAAAHLELTAMPAAGLVDPVLAFEEEGERRGPLWPPYLPLPPKDAEMCLLFSARVFDSVALQRERERRGGSTPGWMGGSFVYLKKGTVRRVFALALAAALDRDEPGPREKNDTQAAKRSHYRRQFSTNSPGAAHDDDTRVGAVALLGSGPARESGPAGRRACWVSSVSTEQGGTSRGNGNNMGCFLHQFVSLSPPASSLRKPHMRYDAMRSGEWETTFDVSLVIVIRRGEQREEESSRRAIPRRELATVAPPLWSVLKAGANPRRRNGHCRSSQSARPLDTCSASSRLDDRSTGPRGILSPLAAFFFPPNLNRTCVSPLALAVENLEARQMFHKALARAGPPAHVRALATSAGIGRARAYLEIGKASGTQKGQPNRRASCRHGLRGIGFRPEPTAPAHARIGRSGGQASRPGARADAPAAADTPPFQVFFWQRGAPAGCPAGWARACGRSVATADGSIWCPTHCLDSGLASAISWGLGLLCGFLKRARRVSDDHVHARWSFVSCQSVRAPDTGPLPTAKRLLEEQAFPCSVSVAHAVLEWRGSDGLRAAGSLIARRRERAGLGYCALAVPSRCGCFDTDRAITMAMVRTKTSDKPTHPLVNQAYFRLRDTVDLSATRRLNSQVLLRDETTTRRESRRFPQREEGADERWTTSTRLTLPTHGAVPDGCMRRPRAGDYSKDGRTARLGSLEGKSIERRRCSAGLHRLWPVRALPTLSHNSELGRGHITSVRLCPFLPDWSEPKVMTAVLDLLSIRWR
ncbi:hypothetical protein HU200_022265 [Digitaria exilis]|uniref:Uncharacterized protein n=1 Tax=Digitaria exilis TaxID=1010633 RepID=A0A835KED7_9POAL|nr:hypothetical protein HU200_022265 [Digitaria exilis]